MPGIVRSWMVVLLTVASPSSWAFDIHVSSPVGCTIVGASGVASEDGPDLQVMGGTLNASCGTTGGSGSPPSVSITATPGGLTVNPASQPSTLLNWQAQGASSCVTQGTPQASFSAFTFQATPATSWSTDTAVNLCSAGTCSGVVQARLASLNPGVYPFEITCANAAGATVSLPASVTVSNPGSGGGATTTGCSPDTASDLPGFTRQCSGTITHSYSAPAYTGPFEELASMIGEWPGDPGYLGQAAIFPLDAGKFAAFAFVPASPHVIKFTTNPSWGAGGWISISTAPGLFNPDTAGVVCGQAFNGSNNLIFGSVHFGGSTCPVLSAGTTYYLNFVDADSQGIGVCHRNQCAIAYTPLGVN